MKDAAHMFIALVTFEHDGDLHDILSPDGAGACCWMAAKTDDEGKLMPLFQSSLSKMGLKLVEVDDVTPIDSIDDVYDYDHHLAEDMMNWAVDQDLAWGTVHIYSGEGEA